MELIKKTAMYILLFITLFLIGIIAFLYLTNNFIGMPDDHRNIDSRVPIAVLGDSDSHSYRDKYVGPLRGGKYHDYTFNWIELWAKLSGDEISPGRWIVTGSPYRGERVKNALGIKNRSPQKLDYEFNYALSGLRCNSLLGSWPYQGEQLINELRSNPEFWAKGLVIIRIGINDFGNRDEILRWAKIGLNDKSSEIISNCVDSITKISDSISSQSPNTKIAILGMTRGYNFADECCQNLEKPEIENIEQVLSLFDNNLKKYASNLSNIAFIDDHFWFNNIFGSQELGNLKPKIDYVGSTELINSSGDHPKNMLLADHHTGTLYNGLWLIQLISELNRQLGTKFSLPRLTDVIKIAGMATQKE